MSMREKSAAPPPLSPPFSPPLPDFDLNTFHNPTSSPHFFVASSISRSWSFPSDAATRVSLALRAPLVALAPPAPPALRPVVTANAGSSRFRTDAIRIRVRPRCIVVVTPAVDAVTALVFFVTLDRIEEELEQVEASLRSTEEAPAGAARVRLSDVVVPDIIIIVMYVCVRSHHSLFPRRALRTSPIRVNGFPSHSARVGSARRGGKTNGVTHRTFPTLDIEKFGSDRPPPGVPTPL
jgi:hypothetical protein